jgi:hypothetical protein
MKVLKNKIRQNINKKLTNNLHSNSIIKKNFTESIIPILNPIAFKESK